MKNTWINLLNIFCGGELLGNGKAYVSGVKIDSRLCGAGDLYVAIIGERNDGNRFAPGAYEGGCRAFLLSDREIAEKLVSSDPEVSVILCDNTEDALQDMAEGYLAEFGGQRIAVTGSVGKTTTKQLVTAVLSRKYRMICTKKNLNTRIGLCLTVFDIEADTEGAVFEMGMDRKDEIKEYVSWVRPDLAVITNIGVSHLEKLGSRDAIADEKLNVVNGFGELNTLIYNQESDYLRTKEEIKARKPGDYDLISVGFKDADITVKDIVNYGEGGIGFTVEGNRQKEFCRLPLVGTHNAIDAALAAAVGLYYGVSLKEAAKAFASVSANDRRMHAESLGGVMLIDDSYNASPDSMKAGISALSGISAQRRIAVLSDMLEIGSAEEQGHVEAGRLAAELGIDVLIAAGKNRDLYRRGAEEAGGKTEVVCLETPEEAKDALMNIIRKGDAVLVKGSNSTGISTAAEAVRNSFGGGEK